MIRAGKWRLASFLPVDHHVVQIDHLTAVSSVVQTVFVVIAETVGLHNDVRTVLLIVCQFVDGIGHTVGFNDQICR